MHCNLTSCPPLPLFPPSFVTPPTPLTTNPLGLVGAAADSTTSSPAPHLLAFASAAAAGPIDVLGLLT